VALRGFDTRSVEREILSRWVAFAAVSGDEANEEQPQAGRLADYLSLGVISRIYRRDLVDEVVAETRRRE
jgi:hypothetical protein